MECAGNAREIVTEEGQIELSMRFPKPGMPRASTIVKSIVTNNTALKVGSWFSRVQLWGHRQSWDTKPPQLPRWISLNQHQAKSAERRHSQLGPGQSIGYLLGGLEMRSTSPRGQGTRLCLEGCRLRLGYRRQVVIILWPDWENCGGR